MGKASRAKRSRAAVRAAKRTRSNTAWYGLIGVIVTIGVVMIVLARGNSQSGLGPLVGKDHWHAALGVYDCNHWVGDGTGEGVWTWPAATQSSSPARVGTSAYAGLHSHGDGLIHMEPQTSDEEGKHATIGKYFDFGGWNLSSTGYTFVGTKVKNGEQCGSAKGTLIWGTAKWDGTTNPQRITPRRGNPASWKLHNNDIVVIAFVAPGTTLDRIGNPPSVGHFAGAEQRTGQNMPAVTTAPSAATPTSTPGSSAPGSSTP